MPEGKARELLKGEWDLTKAEPFVKLSLAAKLKNVAINWRN